MNICADDDDMHVGDDDKNMYVGDYHMYVDDDDMYFDNDDDDMHFDDDDDDMYVGDAKMLAMTTVSKDYKHPDPGTLYSRYPCNSFSLKQHIIEWIMYTLVIKR